MKSIAIIGRDNSIVSYLDKGADFDNGFFYTVKPWENGSWDNVGVFNEDQRLLSLVQGALQPGYVAVFKGE